MVFRVKRYRSGLTCLAQIIVGAAGVHTLESCPDNVCIAAVTDDMGVSDGFVGCTDRDMIRSFGELDKAVPRVSVDDGRRASVAAIPIGTVEALPSDAVYRLRAKITCSRVTSLFVIRNLDTVFETGMQHRLESMIGGV
jgi:hypothetical protein